MIPPLCEDVESIYNRKKVVALMASKVSEKKIGDELDYSLNDLLLRGRVSAQAVEKELPSGEFKDAKKCSHSQRGRMDRDFRLHTSSFLVWTNRCCKSLAG
jgi:hypothetical protein